MTRLTAPDVIRRARSNGIRDVNRRAVRALTRRLSLAFGTAELDFPLRYADIADSTRLNLEPPQAPVPAGRPLKMAWICTPPGPGSGGHTTLFRMVAGMEARGHSCTLMLYDRHGTDLGHATGIIREHWPWLQVKVGMVPANIRGFDACVASSWETAHVLASRGHAPTQRFYFIQDFEPYLYPRGSLYSLAEDSYRFGFRTIALGEMVAAALEDNVGVTSSVIPFGCDTGVYRLQNRGQRNGVVFYARESVDRRGFLLAKLALAEFHGRHPEQQIHVYGDPVSGWEIPHTHHGKLAPPELNSLYNRCVAGLAMSFTNISLVAEEMLASGITPVINDHPFARADLPSSNARWAAATPGGLADALCRAVEEPITAARAERNSGSARQGWSDAQAKFADVVQAGVASCTI
ncbi:MAG: glycosyltransferase family 1 protein [Actinomycetes bacterium]